MQSIPLTWTPSLVTALKVWTAMDRVRAAGSVILWYSVFRIGSPARSRLGLHLDLSLSRLAGASIRFSHFSSTVFLSGMNVFFGTMFVGVRNSIGIAEENKYFVRVYLSSR